MKILNIASVAAFQPVPYLSEYAATKDYYNVMYEPKESGKAWVA